jgi:hypothetical protein
VDHVASQAPDVAAERRNEESRDHSCEEQSHDDDSPTESTAAAIRRLARHAGRSRTGSERAGITNVPPEHNQGSRDGSPARPLGEVSRFTWVTHADSTDDRLDKGIARATIRAQTQQRLRSPIPVTTCTSQVT